MIYYAYFGPLNKVPGPKTTFLSEIFISLKQINGRRWKWLQYYVVPKYGPVVRIAPKMIVISDRDIIKQILVTNELPKSAKYERLRNDKQYDTLFTASCISDLDVIGEAAFGGSFKLVKNGNHPLPKKVFKELRRRVWQSMFPFLRSFMGVDPYLINFMNALIKQRRQSESKRKDILQMLLDTKHLEGGLSDFEVYDQCIEFLIAGSDSTSFTTAMTIIELSKNPDKLKRLSKEVKETLIDEDGDDNKLIPSHNKLKHLPYLNAVISEGLRLFPSTFGKQASEDMVIKGYFIPKETIIAVNIFYLHREKKYWGEDSHEFIPERWLTPEKVPTDCFIPFSAGTRNCIGLNFAWMELRLVIATLVLRYEFKDIPGQDNEILQFITSGLRSKSHYTKVKFQSNN
ncbi:7009_t:CDS:10 [Diversispora eburnea]|uniref:7009_t:CDS:1 n=1 Tax=Diversispora eburnea TaxID=1213867 RepID=A0A9N8V0T5_9GLOM|nr:7009_t:CDS:10 [Diversispora eburnea]